MRFLLLLAALLVPSLAWAQNAAQTVSEQPPVAQGVGAMTVSTSATIASLVTMNANSPTQWPTGGYAPPHIWLRNLGSTDIAFCPWGGTCTCPETSTVNTVGYTIQAGQGAFGFTLSVGGVPLAYNKSTIVSCSGTNQVEVDIQ